MIYPKTIYKFLLSAYFLLASLNSFSQTINIDSTQTPKFFRGQITATNNGVSLIPSFSLGKPAVLFDLNIGKGRLSFDPMLRFSATGKPWAFIFWWRYKIIQNKKFSMGVGAHPSFVFRDVSIVDSKGDTKDFMKVQRFFAWEATPFFVINKNLNFGFNYLGSKGLTKDIIQSTTFLALRSGITMNLSKKMTLVFIPQAYYLKMDATKGTYVNATVNLYKKRFPVSINGVVSQAIKTDIAGKPFLWSLGLVYNLNNTYYKKK